ncbi:hypothetical protein [Pikeienuella sp. HZG-20]|uniref:cell division protein FtsL n=1 Tax=Paludibacillus litoralis TaxID=3133267 RepID=UPI0030ECC2A5
MRWVLYVVGAALIVVASFWSYSTTYATQGRLESIAKLNSAIAAEREEIQVLQAEWAWLNSPDRLNRLVAANQDALGLEPMKPSRFAELSEAPMRQPDDGLAPVALIDLDALSPEEPARRSGGGQAARPSPPKAPKPVVIAEAREPAPHRAAAPEPAIPVLIPAAPARSAPAAPTATPARPSHRAWESDPMRINR